MSNGLTQAFYILIFGGVEKHLLLSSWKNLSTETVKGLALSLESVDNVESCDGLSAGMLGVRDGILDDGLEEGLENTSGFFVHQTGKTLDTTSASKTANGGLGDALDGITHNLTMTLGAALAETFSSFAGHCCNEMECNNQWG